MERHDPNLERIDYWRRSGDRRQLTEFLGVGHVRKIGGSTQISRRIHRRRIVLAVLAAVVLAIGFFRGLFG